MLKGNPPPVHSRPTFNDDPVDTKEDSDGEFRDLKNRNYILDNLDPVKFRNNDKKITCNIVNIK